jgi:hypothetical protein
LCWYHHHVAIHSLGYRIDPTSPVHRRQLLKPQNHGPPENLAHPSAPSQPAGDTSTENR